MSTSHLYIDSVLKECLCHPALRCIQLRNNKQHQCSMWNQCKAHRFLWDLKIRVLSSLRSQLVLQGCAVRTAAGPTILLEHIQLLVAETLDSNRSPTIGNVPDSITFFIQELGKSQNQLIQRLKNITMELDSIHLSLPASVSWFCPLTWFLQCCQRLHFWVSDRNIPTSR